MEIEMFLQAILLLVIASLEVCQTASNNYSPSGTPQPELLKPGRKGMVILNVTIYQSENLDIHSQSVETYNLTWDIVPIHDEFLSQQLDMRQRAVDNDDIRTTGAPGGVFGAIEYFLKAIPAFPGAAVETVGGLVRQVPRLLGINVTQIYNSTLSGVRTNPIGTAVQAINNVAFCNPLFAGINAGRCRGFFMAN